MSGPKSVSVAVSSARPAPSTYSGWGGEAARAHAASEAAARERARAAALKARVEKARARATDLSQELSKIAEQWRAARERYGGEFPAWPHDDAASPEHIASLGRPEDLERCIPDLTRRVTQARTACAARLTVFKMRTSLQAAARSPAPGPSAAAGEPAPTAEQERERCAEEVSRLIDKLTADVSGEDRAAVEERAQEAVESPLASRRKALLAQLRLDIQRANEAGRARRRTLDQVEGWREKLSGLAGAEVEQLDAALGRILDGGEPPPDMGPRVDAAAARATAASTRGYAMAVIREELENLGYVVEAGFETASPEAPEMLLSKPDLGDGYHVSLRADADEPMLHARVVREAADDDAPGDDRPSDPERGRRDRETESAWCRDLAAALAAAERKGLSARIARRTKAGDVPVQTIPARERKGRDKKKSRRKRAGQLKSRVAR